MPLVSDEILLAVIDTCISELTLGILLHYNRAKVLGYLEELEGSPDEEHAIVDQEGYDIFGQPKEVKVEDIDCPECHRLVAATRFAPHLEKCMGMGRYSSRVARRRIANVHTPPENEDTLDEEDDIWGSKAKRAKTKRNGSPKLTKRMLGKVKTDLSSSSPRCYSSQQISSSPPIVITDTEGSDRDTFEALSPQSKEKFLRAMCGVVSEYTKKLCTRSMRCPQHTDEQRATARSLLLNYSYHGNTTLQSPVAGANEETGSDSSLTTDVTWAPGTKKKRGKCKAKKGLLL